eukprot:scaffold44488_cov79-Cyclotella_meneghiniana.AAC.2
MPDNKPDHKIERQCKQAADNKAKPPQPNLLSPAVDPPSAAASLSYPPPQPSTSAVPQSTYIR